MAKKGLRVSFFGMVASWFGKANHAYCRAVGQQLHMPWDPLNRGPYTSILSLCVYPGFFYLPSVSGHARGLSDNDKCTWWCGDMMANQKTNHSSIRAKWTAAFCLELWNPISLRETSWTVFKTIHRAFVARVWTPWDQFTQGRLRCKRCSHTFPCGSCGCLTSLRQHFRCPNTKSYWRREFWTWEMDRNGSCSVLKRVRNKIVMSSCGRGVFLECPNGHTSMFTSSTIISPLWSLPSYVHIRGIRSLVALIQALFSVAFAGTNVPAQIWVLESLSRKDPGMLHQQTPSRYCILAYWKPWWWLWSPIPIFFC